MLTRLAPDARSLVASAEDEARSHGSPVVEAEHLLLAMSARPDTDAGHVLVSVGLTRDAIDRALTLEFESSLATAGVSVAVADLGRPSPELPRRRRLGGSFKSAMVRAVTAAKGSGQIRPAHLLLGVLGAQVGTVPRALHVAGVDQDELARLTEHALANPRAS